MTNIPAINYQSLFPPVNQVNGYTGQTAKPTEGVQAQQVGQVEQQQQAQGVNPFAAPQPASTVVASCNKLDSVDIGRNRDVFGYMGCSKMFFA